MARLDFEKAKRRAAVPREPRDTAQGRGARQAALAAFVAEHGLSCFKCGAESAEWAKTGISERGPWAICVPCVSSGSEAHLETTGATAPPERDPRRGAAEVVVYTDGACSRNPGPGGYAAVIVGVLPGEPRVVSGGEGETTNNRMELRAAVEGLNALDPSPSIEVVTDSEYVLKGYTEWLPGWVDRGWRTSAKKPVKNADLWMELDAAARRHGQVTWRWTRGHSGDRFNEMAHTAAERIASS